MDDLAKLISALAALAWPAVFAVLLVKLFGPIRALVESARGRKFTIKVAGNELTMEEASEQQRVLLADLQNKLAQLEKGLASPVAVAPATEARPRGKRVLWVDDRPRNNSFLVASLQDRGVQVDIALSTTEGLEALKQARYDAVISDMGRPEGETAGIDLALKMKTVAPGVPVFIYCGKWGATHLRDDALAAGVVLITSSASSLMAALPL
ncbi:response regulator [Roseateles sp. DXS20W]|uniref:Response regulator n=1 Tax=Pelomonas lactea TaxID=3299030 RepID=A0ABW7GJG3_9BURK